MFDQVMFGSASIYDVLTSSTRLSYTPWYKTYIRVKIAGKLVGYARNRCIIVIVFPLFRLTSTLFRFVSNVSNVSVWCLGQDVGFDSIAS